MNQTRRFSSKLLEGIHIPPRFNKLLQESSAVHDRPAIRSLKPLKQLQASVVAVQPLSTSQKRLLNNIKHSLIDILQNDPLPRQLLFAVKIEDVAFSQGNKRVNVRWTPETIVSSMYTPTHRVTPPAELAVILQKMSVLFRELIVQRLGHGVCTPMIPPLDFKLDQKTPAQQELERRIKLIEQEQKKE